MADISINWDGSRGDWRLAGVALETGNDLRTAVLISLFSDRQATDAELVTYGDTDPRGWWGDASDEPPVGSRLWLLMREKQTQETLRRAQDYIGEALRWLVDDGVAARVDIACRWVNRSQLSARVDVFRNDGNVQPIQFDWAWKGVA